jgi:hypothetical protein
MSEINTQELSGRISASLKKAQQIAASLQKTNNWLMVASILCSALSTLVAGVTSVNGPVAGEGEAGWRLACIVAAILSLITSITVGINQQLRFSDRLAESNRCVGELRALDVAVITGNRNWEEIAKAYQAAVQQYPSLV